jgi:hypothetical protein
VFGVVDVAWASQYVVAVHLLSWRQCDGCLHNECMRFLK